MKRIALDYHNLVHPGKDPITASTSTTDSILNMGNIFTDSIPKGYDQINFHSIVRGTSKKKI